MSSPGDTDLSSSAAASLQVERDVPLPPLTSIRLGGVAAYFARIRSEVELEAALGFAETNSLAVLVLGGGSNLVVADEGFAGLVLYLELLGVAIEPKGDHALVTAAAGENWDALVTQVVRAELAGLECLAGIPGHVGATPIQNVGAYGQEVCDSIVLVRAMHRQTREKRTFSSDECDFAYRDSAFKHALQDWIVLEVTFRLEAGGAPALRYRELQNAFAESSTPSLEEVRSTVIELRGRKGMLGGPNALASAGSFFTNPIVPVAQADEVERRARAAGVLAPDERMPRFPVTIPAKERSSAPDVRVKLAAAWLIERAGFKKGTRFGNVGISPFHTLALVHHGGGSTRDLLAFAGEIALGVEGAFGVQLEQEPRLVE